MPARASAVGLLLVQQNIMREPRKRLLFAIWAEVHSWGHRKHVLCTLESSFGISLLVYKHERT